jgi:DNA repair exonuclease SbcCD ATPase subunit
MYDFISKYHKISKEILRTIRPEIESLRRTLEDKKETVRTLTNNMLSYIEKWEAAEDSKQRRVEELMEELEEWKKVNPQEELRLRQTLKVLKQEKESLVNKKESYENNLMETRANLKRLNKKLIEKTTEIEEINDDPGKCPVCQNEIKDSLLHEYLDKREQEKKEIISSISEHENSLKKMNKHLDKVQKEIDKTTEEIGKSNEFVATDLTDKEIRNLHDKITGAESEVKTLKSQLGDKIEDNDYIKETQKEIDAIKLKTKKIRKKIKKLEIEQLHYEWWRDALGNSPSSMKAFCVNHILMSLNKYIKYYLNFFGYDISYELNSELEDVIIKDDEQVSFNQLSGGEKRSVEISLVFSLYEIVRLKMPDNINIIVLDEMLSNYLDEVRITGALELLSELEERKLSIFVIDHRNLIKENLDCRTIKVVKNKQGISSLELDK